MGRGRGMRPAFADLTGYGDFSNLLASPPVLASLFSNLILPFARPGLTNPLADTAATSRANHEIRALAADSQVPSHLTLRA